MPTEPSTSSPLSIGVVFNVAYLHGRVVSTTDAQEARMTLWRPADHARIHLWDRDAQIGPALLRQDVLVEATVESNEEGEPVLVLRRFATGGPGKWVWSPTPPPMAPAPLVEVAGRLRSADGTLLAEVDGQGCVRDVVGPA